MLIMSISFGHLLGQSPHSFTMEPAAIFGTAQYSFGGLYTPNGKDFLSRSHGNNFIDPLYGRIDDQVHSWSSVGYMRKISQTQNGSFFYAQVSVEFYESFGGLGLRGGLGWMKSLRSNLFLDINLHYNYLSSPTHLPGGNLNSVHHIQLPLSLKSFLTIDDFGISSFNLNDTKWRIRKHSIGLISSSWRSRTEVSFYTDLNVGYRLQKWLIIEGILRGHHDFNTPIFSTFARYGLGVNIQPYQWKRLIPYVGISLESDYIKSPSSSLIIIPFNRKNNILVSDYNIGLEYRLNRHFSLSVQYTAPVFQAIAFLPTYPQLELGTVYQF